MKNKLIVLSAALLMTANAFAAETTSCFKMNNPAQKNLVIVTFEDSKVKRVQYGAIDDHSPVESTLVLSGGCRNTQSGETICKPDVEVPLYVNFAKKEVSAIFFKVGQKSGALRIPAVPYYQDFYLVACPIR